METYDSFQAIPQFMRANWRCNFDWEYLQQTMGAWSNGLTYIEREPDFQRCHVWSEAQQRAYVEYRLRGGPSAGELQWNCSVWGDFRNKTPQPIQLVDGLQRLTAVEKFMSEELKAFGHYRKEFKGYLRADFVFFVHNLKTRREVLEWYLQLNDGGVVHTKEELNRVKKLLAEEKLNVRGA